MTPKTMRFEFHVAAVPKGRPRVTKRGFAYTPSKTAKFERSIYELAKIQMGDLFPMTGPLRASIKIVWRKPRRPANNYPSKSDLDNCVKGITDALNGLVYLDDSQITRLHASKDWGEFDMIKLKISRLG